MGHKVKQSLMSSRIDFFYYAFRNVLLVSIPLLVVSGLVLSHLSFHSSATDSSSGSTSSTDNLSFSISSSCTLSSVVDSSHTAELINGTYTNGIGKTTITTLCNDGNGYSVYAVGYSNNEEGNNRLVNTESSNFNIVSGIAESGNTSNWAMSLNNLKDDPSLTPPTITLDYDGIYGIVPDKWTKVASLPAKATDMIKGSSFTTTYAVYTSSSQYAGTYNGQVKYMLVHPNNNKPTLSNIELAFASHGIQPIYRDEDNKYYYAMQDMTTDICSSVSGDGETTATQLVDTRDNKLYWVAKLEDDHCWMTQNLDFDISANTTLNSQTTDLNEYNVAGYSDGYTKLGNIIYWTPVNTAVIFNGSTVADWQDSNTIPYSASKTDNTETEHSSLGNWYNWTAAIASNDSIMITNSTNNSICPSGWKLPNASDKEIGNLLADYDIISTNTSTTYLPNGFSKMIIAPLYFLQSGSIRGRQLLTSEGYGSIWSNMANGSSDAYNLDFNSTNIRPANSGSREFGRPIRCLAR